jgi:hypothetical protein
MMTLQQLAETIVQRAQGRYDVRSLEDLELSLPEVERPSQVLRLKRSNSETAGWRTILLVEVPLASVQLAHQWAADVRDVLPEPETSDLYMFLLVGNIANDDAARIETDDRFCRKIVAREREEVTDFLDRTFLATLNPAGDVEKLSDPLESALNSLSAAHPWTSPYLLAWKAELLSNASGTEVAQVFRESLVVNEDQQ